MASRFGPWQPLTVIEVVDLFSPLSVPWWISGGHALELHLGRSWRSHDDIDVSFRRDDAGVVYALLADLDLHRASAGVLSRWRGEALLPDAHQNNVWVRATPEGPWCLDLTISDGDDRNWIFRRDRSIRRPWPDAVLRNEHGVPYLAPELQLLFKARDRRPKDDVDADEVVPELSDDGRRFLRATLAPDHHWQRLL